MAAPRDGSPFGTVLTAMITPMFADGAIDYDGAARLAAYLVDAGNDGIVVNGTTGEAPTTSDEEKLRLVEVVMDAVGGRCVVVAGVGTNDTRHTLELAQAAQKAGAHGLLAVTPYYNKPPQAGVVRHFLTLADAVDLPIMLYDIPGRSGTEIASDSLRTLAEHPNISAVKDAKGNLEAVVDLLRSTELFWYSGDDGLNLPFLSIGACGFVSVTGHLVAARLKDMAEAYFCGNVRHAIEINESLQPVSTGIFRTQGAILTKAALNQLGLPAGPLRLPLVEATDAQIEQLRQDLGDGGVEGFAS